MSSISLAILVRSDLRASLASRSFAHSLPLLSPLRSSTSFIDPCSSQRQQLRRPSPLSPSLSPSLPPLFSSYSRPTPRLCSPLLSSSLRNIRTYSSGRPTDRPTDRSPSVQCWRQCSSKKPPPSSDCRHTTDRCYRVVVAAAVTTTSTYQRKFSSSKGEKTYPLIAQLTRFTISDL